VHRALSGHDLIPDIRPAGLPQGIVAAGMPEERPAVHYRHDPLPPGLVSEPTHAGTVATDQRLRQTELVPETQAPESTVPPLTVIGQFGGIYFLATTPSGELIVIDQHAAHERILYEQAGQKDERENRVQELIAPVLLHRTPRESQVLASLIPDLAKEGFIIEEFGRDTFLVRAVPVVLGKLEDTSLLDDIVSDLTSTERSQRVDNRERITRIVACRGAIKAGTVCTPEQCQRVADQLRLTKQPYTCPHGRPTMIRFSREDLDTLFKRS